jgi:antirestriction protein ArdC
METKKTTDVFAIVTNRIIDQLKQNIVPWQKPWTEAGYPINLTTKILYRGMNVWMLASLGYAQNYFLTWKQLKALGGNVKTGEKGHIVIFWKPAEKRERENDNQTNSEPAPILRYYMVYNIAQCDGISEMFTIPDSPYPVSTIGACDEIIERMPNCPTIKHTKQKAFYSPSKDYINMPKQQTFKNTESYYSTLFHELVHSTGHGSRLNRKGIVDNPDFGTEMYSQEELVAEIGACFLNSAAGIEHIEFDNSVAYINNWLERLQSDTRLIVYASIQAQKAVEYILNVRPYEKPETVQAEMFETL